MNLHEISGHGLTHNGVPVKIMCDPYPGFSGMAYKKPTYCGSNLGQSSYCNGCSNVKDHIQQYLTKWLPMKPGKAVPKHYTIYLNTEETRLLNELTASVEPNRIVAVSTGPVICKKCWFKNDYGANNQTDGTYVCYMCR